MALTRFPTRPIIARIVDCGRVAPQLEVAERLLHIGNRIMGMTTFVIATICAAAGFGAAWLLLGKRLNGVREARTDMLTGLRNRRSFQEELLRLFAQRQRQGVVFSLLMIDIDHFKDFNDVYGHLAGDLVLRSVAQVLANTVRQIDLVCRYGGDEFAVICPGTALDVAATAAERIRLAVASQPVPLKDRQIQITASVGVAEVIRSEVAEELIQRADEALYTAKHAGRNRIALRAPTDPVSVE